VYKIYCQNLYPEMVEAILQARVDGYTITEGRGAYHGKPEKSLVIDLVGVDPWKVWEVAQAIREMQNQEEVMVLHLDGTFVNAVRAEAIQPKVAA
jgi:uncharacterized membrane-anchored protein YitT (DUF2179 family)